jgi:hypothetical protein
MTAIKITMHCINKAYLIKSLKRKIVHIKRIIALSLICGGLGCLLIYFGKNPDWLIISLVGTGIASAPMPTMPSSILTNPGMTGKIIN